MEITGFYIVSDKFFSDFPDPYLKGNKNEKRPHYYAYKDSTGLFWMIPMSSRVDKYQRIIASRTARNKPCDIFHIAKLDNNKTSVFLIGDMFPITEEYILRKYTINSNHLRVTSEHLANEINRKVKKVLKLIRHGAKFSNTQPDVLKIEQDLLSRLQNVTN